MKSFIQTSKGKVIIGISVILIAVAAVLGFNKYTEYQVSITSNVVFVPELVLGTSDDPMTLVKSYDADEVVFTTIVADDIAYGPDQLINLSPGGYKFIYQATKGGKATDIAIEVLINDNTAPVLENVVPEVEMDYGIEFNPEGNVKAIDNVDGEVEVLINIVKYQENPQRIDIEYLAKDTAGNESSALSIINVKAPTCALNATFSWEEGDCGCNAGYTGDGWSSCTVKKTASSNSTTINKNSGGSNSNGSSGQTSSNATSKSSGGLSWEVEIPSQEAINKAYAEGNAKYGEGVGWGANLDSAGNITEWWQ